MLSIFNRAFFGLKCNFLGSCIYRNFKSDYPLLPGGGLEKLQGGFKEEQYFNINESKLLAKLRDQYSKGTKLECGNCYGNWDEYEKVFLSKQPIAIRESCCLNKHKNCMEEAFFFNVEAENMQLLQKKMTDDGSLQPQLDTTLAKSKV